VGDEKPSLGRIADRSQLGVEPRGRDGLARIAVSGHSVTQVMQPTHRSAMASGISGER